MSITVTLKDTTKVLPDGANWAVNPDGYLEIFSRSPHVLLATFAPGWLVVADTTKDTP